MPGNLTKYHLCCSKTNLTGRVSCDLRKYSQTNEYSLAPEKNTGLYDNLLKIILQFPIDFAHLHHKSCDSPLEQMPASHLLQQTGSSFSRTASASLTKPGLSGVPGKPSPHLARTSFQEGELLHGSARWCLFGTFLFLSFCCSRGCRFVSRVRLT